MGHTYGTPLLDILLGHSCGTPLQDTLVGHSCKKLLRGTLLGHSCRTLLWVTLVGNSCRTLLWVSRVRQPYGTLLWDTLLGHSGGTPAGDYCRTLFRALPANVRKFSFAIGAFVRMHVSRPAIVGVCFVPFRAGLIAKCVSTDRRGQKKEHLNSQGPAASCVHTRASLYMPTEPQTKGKGTAWAP